MNRLRRMILAALGLALATGQASCAHRRPLLFPGDYGPAARPAGVGQAAAPRVGVQARPRRSPAEPGLAADAVEPGVHTRVEGSID